MGNIVWLASYPKSGNTWMRAFLNNLFSDSARAVNVNRLQGRLFDGDGGILWYRVLDPRPVAEWTAEDIARLRPRVHETIAGGRQGTVFCKTHNAVMMARGYPSINMEVSAGAIYIVRNPLDVTLSFADFMGTGVDEAIGAMARENWESDFDDNGNVPHMLGSWSQHVESWTGRPGRGLHVVRYEDMLARPLATFAAVARFLGLKPPRRRLQRAVENSSFRVLAGQEQRHGFGERSKHQQRFFRKGTAGQWQRELTPQQVERICATHRRQMARFDYLPEDAHGARHGTQRRAAFPGTRQPC